MLGAQRVVLGKRQAKRPAGRHAWPGQRRDGRDGLGARPGPGGLDGPLDQSRRDLTGHPESDGEPAVRCRELEAEMRLAAEESPPGRAEQGDEIGPQGGRPLRIDLGRGEDPHEPGALAHAARLGPASQRHRHDADQRHSEGARPYGLRQVGEHLGEVVEDPGGRRAGVGEVAG